MRRIERALVLIGVLALGWVGAVHVFTTLEQWQQNRELEELRSARPAVRTGARDVRLPAPGGEPPVSTTRSKRLDIVRPEPVEGTLIGRIEAPRLGLSAIVREGVENATLRRAVGHVPETPLPGEAGNVAFAAHRDTFFRPLRGVREGDAIHVSTPDGVHEYRVATTRIVNPEDVSVLAATREPTLTLITCYPFNYVGSAPQRFIVTATPATAAAGRIPSIEPSTAEAQPIALAASAAPVATTGVNNLVAEGGKKSVRNEPRRFPRRPVRASNSGSSQRPQSKVTKANPWDQKKISQRPEKTGFWRKFLRVLKGPPQPRHR